MAVLLILRQVIKTLHGGGIAGVPRSEHLNTSHRWLEVANMPPTTKTSLKYRHHKPCTTGDHSVAAYYLALFLDKRICLLDFLWAQCHFVRFRRRRSHVASSSSILSYQWMVVPGECLHAMSLLTPSRLCQKISRHEYFRRVDLLPMEI